MLHYLQTVCCFVVWLVFFLLHNLHSFVVKSVLSQFTHFLCAEKFNQKLPMWRKNDKYQVCLCFYPTFRTAPFPKFHIFRHSKIICCQDRHIFQKTSSVPIWQISTILYLYAAISAHCICLKSSLCMYLFSFYIAIALDLNFSKKNSFYFLMDFGQCLF